MKIALVVALALVAVGVTWRLAGWPCPPWLTFLLENRYVGAVLGSEKLLDRAGVAPGMVVLDMGCGPGRLTLPAADRVGPEGRVVAVDIQPAMIERLERRLAGRANVTTLVAGAGEGRLEAGVFDRAYLVTVLGEIRDQAAALREIHAALKAGGVLSVSELIPDPHYQGRKRVRRLARDAGFDVDATFGTWLAFTMNFVKPS